MKSLDWVWPLLGRRHRLVDAHFAGRSTPAQDRALWRHLPGCDACQARYRARSLLEALEPDFAARAQRRMARGLFAERRSVALPVGVLCVAAAGALLWVRPKAADPAFTARGGVAASAAGPRLDVYRVPASGAPERAGAVLRKSDALAFAYINPPAAAATHLTIVAVDAKGHASWFWPAVANAGDDPAALSIATSAAPVELQEAVGRGLPLGPLTVYGVFSRAPVRVRALEVALKAGALSAIDGSVWSQRFDVLPE